MGFGANHFLSLDPGVLTYKMLELNEMMLKTSCGLDNLSLGLMVAVRTSCRCCESTRCHTPFQRGSHSEFRLMLLISICFSMILSWKRLQRGTRSSGFRYLRVSLILKTDSEECWHRLCCVGRLASQCPQLLNTCEVHHLPRTELCGSVIKEWKGWRTEVAEFLLLSLICHLFLNSFKN